LLSSDYRIEEILFAVILKGDDSWRFEKMILDVIFGVSDKLIINEP
jgi:hypothetical protein